VGQRRHGRHAGQARAAQQAQQHGFGLVVAVMGQQHQRHAVVLGQAGQGCVAGVARGGLDAFAGGLVHLDPRQPQRQAQQIGQPPHLLAPAIGGRLQAVVHMEQQHLDARGARHGRRMHGQHGRVGAAADGHGDTPRRLRQGLQGTP